jgi:hypothetical protein
MSVFGAISIQEIRERVLFEVLRGRVSRNREKHKGPDVFWTYRFPDWVTEKISSLGRRLPELTKPFLPQGVSIQLFEEELLTCGLIICLDDIERVSERAGIEQLLGYINELKEVRQAKVVLIYNHEGLGEKESNFKRFQEKVIDKRIPFAPGTRDILGFIFNEQNANQFDDGLVEELVR